MEQRSHRYPICGYGWFCLNEASPPLFIHFFIVSYKRASAVIMHDGKPITIIRFDSGVPQGCPASAMLFDIALDLFLSRMAES